MSQCSSIAEVYLSKRARSHSTMTKIWATPYFHLAQSMDKFENRPQVQYEATNKIRPGFVIKEDAQRFIEHVLSSLTEVGYSFKTEHPPHPPKWLWKLVQQALKVKEPTHRTVRCDSQS